MAWNSNATPVDTAKTAASSILCAPPGLTAIRQREAVETSEKRGLTKTAALAAAGVMDDTSQTTYYRYYGRRVYSFTATTGTKTVATARRANDADGWTLTTTVTTYSIHPATLPNGWGTTPLDPDGNPISLSAGGDSGIVVSYQTQLSHVYTWTTFASSSSSTTLTSALFSKTETTVTEYRHFNSEASAQAKANSLTSANVAFTTLVAPYRQTAVQSAYRTLPTGTTTTAVVRQASNGEGWTVVATSVSLSYQSNPANSWGPAS